MSENVTPSVLLKVQSEGDKSRLGELTRNQVLQGLRRSRRGQGKEAETKHSTAAQRRSPAGPLSGSLPPPSAPWAPGAAADRPTGWAAGPGGREGRQRGARRTRNRRPEGSAPGRSLRALERAAPPPQSAARRPQTPARPPALTGPGPRGAAWGRRRPPARREVCGRPGAAEVAAAGPGCAASPSGPRTAGAEPDPALGSLRPGRPVQVLLLLCSSQQLIGRSARRRAPPSRPEPCRARPGPTNRRRGGPGAALREVVTNARDLAPGPRRAPLRNKPGQQNPGAQSGGRGERKGGREGLGGGGERRGRGRFPGSGRQRGAEEVLPRDGSAEGDLSLSDPSDRVRGPFGARRTRNVFSCERNVKDPGRAGANACESPTWPACG
uniref:translation initiation factor IF-2-like n=1 Tax=Callithrix jacchus TaxID=9483 RepID=UPI0023DD0577|nr:translation initiation factor IF-2-like [Callithrix jacchus]